MAAAVLAAAAMLAAAPALADDHTGSCVDKAPNLIVSTKDDKPKSFVLTPEYDEDTGKYYYEESYTNSQGVVTNVVATTNFDYYFKLNCKNGTPFLESVLFSFAAALGFGFALVLFSGIREKLALADPPRCFRGVALALVTAGLLSLAFMGFNGLVKTPY